MSKIAELTAKLSAKDEGFSSKLRSAAAELKKFEQGGKGLAGAWKTFGASLQGVGERMSQQLTAPLLLMGGAATAAALQFDEASATIRVGTGATGEALAGLQEDFTAVFRVLPNTAAEVGTAIADLNTRLGLTGEPLRALASQTLNLARITGEQVQPLIQSTSRVMGDWGVSNAKTADTMDYLFKVSQTTGIGVTQLSGRLVQFGAPLRQMGFSFEEAAVMMGKFEKEGVNTELVLGSMRQALTNFSREGVTDTKGALLDLMEKIKSVGSAGEATAIAMKYFGAEAGPDMAAAIREGRFEFAQLLEVVGASGETINKSADDAQTLTDRLKQLRNEATAAAAPVGEVLVGALEDAVRLGLRPMLEEMGNLARGFAELPPAIQATTVALGALATSAGPVLFVFGQMAQGIASIIALKAPIVAVLKAVALPVVGLTAALLALKVAWDNLSNGTAAAIDNVQRAKQGLMGAQGTNVLFAAGLEDIATTAKHAGEAVGDAAQKAKTSLGGSTGAVDRLKQAFQELGFESARELEAGQKRALENLKVIEEAYKRGRASAEDLAQAQWTVYQAAERTLGPMVSLRQAIDDLNQKAADRKASEEFVNAWVRGLDDVQAGVRRLIEPPNLEEFGRQAMTAEQLVESLSQGLQRAAEKAGEIQFGQQIRDAKELAEALSRLGVQKGPNLEQMKKDLELVLTGDTTTKQKAEAEIAVLEARRRAGQTLSKEESARLGELKRQTQETGKVVDSVWSEVARRTSQVFQQVSKSIADLLWEGGKFSDRMKKILTEFAKGLTQLGLERLFGLMGKGLSSLSKSLPGLGGLGKILSGSSSAAPAAANTAANATGGLNAALGTATSGLMGTLGAIGSLGSMVSGLIGNFQTAKTNKLLGETTRGIIGLVGNSTGLNEQMNRYLPALQGIHERLMEIRNLGVRVFTTDSPLEVVGAGISGGGGVTINMAGASFIGFRDLDAFLDELARRLRQRGV